MTYPQDYEALHAEQLAAAREAVAAAMSVDARYTQAAGSTPGMGAPVSLPSVTDQPGFSTQGRGFDQPEASPAPPVVGSGEQLSQVGQVPWPAAGQPGTAAS